jgi:phage shock protein E
VERRCNADVSARSTAHPSRRAAQRLRIGTLDAIDSCMFRRIALVLALSMLAACSVATGEEQPSEQGGAARPTPRQAVAQADLVVDVRTPAEYAAGHLDRAILIPHDELDARLGELDAALGGDRTKKVVVYCASGRRSGIAKDLLEKRGFVAVTNAGGYRDLR